jgi:hypothetical protein
MSSIILSKEQEKVVAQANEGVEVRTEEGRLVAFLTPVSPEEAAYIAVARERMRRGGDGIPSAEVQAHMRKLEEISQRETLDEARVLELLRRMRAGEAV